MIQYRKFTSGDELGITALVRGTYDEFVAPDYSDEGNKTFYDYIEPNLLKKRQSEGNALYIGTEDGKIVGMMEVRNINHISLLFVDKDYQGRGIAKTLLRNLLSEIPKDTQLIEVHASPFSIPIYQKLGFQGIGNMREENGIKYLQMEQVLKHK